MKTVVRRRDNRGRHLYSADSDGRARNRPPLAGVSAHVIETLGLFEAHLPVADLARAVDFYGNTLGLPLAYAIDGKAAFFWVPSPGRAMLGLWAAPSPQQMLLHIAFRTTADALIASVAALRAAGIAPLDFESRPTDEPVVIAWMPALAIYFRDPDGHLLEYIAMLDEPSQPELGVVSLQRWRDLRRG